MDQCRNRRRAGHGVRQPDEERQLRRFAGHAQEHEQSDQKHRGGVRCRDRRGRGKNRGKIEAAKIPEDEEHGHEQTKITDAVGNEGLLGRQRIADAVLALLEPEADEQVRTQANPLPTHEEH